jgi:hypothetical protein
VLFVPERLLNVIEGGQTNEHQFNEFDLRVVVMGDRKLIIIGTEIPGFGRVQFFCGTRPKWVAVEDWLMVDLLAIDVGSHAIPLKPDVGTFQQTDANGWSAQISIVADLKSLDQPLAVVIPTDHPLRGWFHPTNWHTLTVTVRKRDAEAEPA